jgi:hypothetical protein
VFCLKKTLSRYLGIYNENMPDTLYWWFAGHDIKHFAIGISALKTTEILIRLLLGMQERRGRF